MSDVEHARFLLKKAHADLKALTGMLDANTFEDAIFGFHAQQTVEKALKAFLSYNDIAFRKVHDLEELAGLLENKKLSIPETFKNLLDLSDFAVQFRYESYEDAPVGLQRKNLIANLSEFIAYIEQQIQ